MFKILPPLEQAASWIRFLARGGGLLQKARTVKKMEWQLGHICLSVVKGMSLSPPEARAGQWKNPDVA